MLCNFDFVDLRHEDSGSFISGARRKSYSVRLAWGWSSWHLLWHNGDVRYFCHTRRKESDERLQFTFTNSCLVNKVIHFVSRLSTCFHHSVVWIILNYCCDWAMIITQPSLIFHKLFSLRKSKIRDYYRWYERQRKAIIHSPSTFIFENLSLSDKLESLWSTKLIVWMLMV